MSKKFFAGPSDNASNVVKLSLEQIPKPPRQSEDETAFSDAEDETSRILDSNHTLLLLISEKERTISNLENNIVGLKKKLVQLEKVINNCSEEISSVREESEEWKKEAFKTQADINNIKHDHVVESPEFQELKSQYADLKSLHEESVKEYEEKTSKIETESNRLKDEVLAGEEKLRQLRGLMESTLQTQRANLEAAFTDQLKAMEREWSDKVAAAKDLSCLTLEAKAEMSEQASGKKIQYLEEENLQLSTQVNQLLRERSGLQDTIRQLETDNPIYRTTDTYRILQQDRQTLWEQLQEVTADRDRLATQLEMAEKAAGVISERMTVEIAHLSVENMQLAGDLLQHARAPPKHQPRSRPQAIPCTPFHDIRPEPKPQQHQLHCPSSPVLKDSTPPPPPSRTSMASVARRGPAHSDT